MSTNDGLAHQDIDDLQQECATLEEAKRTVGQWHVERYADNDAEFDEYGGNTAAREQFETAQWTGKFKCRTCGEPITDSYRIQGILHHGPALVRVIDDKTVICGSRSFNMFSIDSKHD